ncbi:hypothetical protein FO601_38995, partial [Bacillus thuringiensis]|nr:hypothetical protein [Bacillus thuringiensis]
QKLALERISMWLLDNNRIQKKLLELGVSLNDVKYWYEYVEKTLQNYSLTNHKKTCKEHYYGISNNLQSKRNKLLLCRKIGW